MNAHALKLLIDDLHKVRLEVMNIKGKDYTRSNEDRLHNFKSIAKELNLDPLQIWYVYFRKHIDAIAAYIITGKVESESIVGRFIDAHNYLDLGLALIADSGPFEDSLVWRELQNEHRSKDNSANNEDN